MTTESSLKVAIESIFPNVYDDCQVPITTMTRRIPDRHANAVEATGIYTKKHVPKTESHGLATKAGTTKHNCNLL